MAMLVPNVGDGIPEVIVPISTNVSVVCLLSTMNWTVLTNLGFLIVAENLGTLSSWSTQDFQADPPSCRPFLQFS
jgi:hypothetical protein